MQVYQIINKLCIAYLVEASWTLPEASELWLFRELRPELKALSFFLGPFIGGIGNPPLKYRLIPYLTMCLVELIWDTLFLVFWKIGADFHNETVQL